MKQKDRTLELDFSRKLARHHGIPDVEKLSLLDILVRFGELLTNLQHPTPTSRIVPSEELNGSKEN